MQRYFAKERKDNGFILNDNDIYHIKTVMRMKNDDLVEIVDNNEVFICEVNLKTLLFKIIKKQEQKQDKTEITLLLPLLKEQKMDLVLEKSTELGVSRIIPIVTERSIIKLDEERITKKYERWYKICKEASEQCKRIDIPQIETIHHIEDLKCLNGVKLVCSTVEKDKNLHFFEQTIKTCGKIVIAVGPEGGFTTIEEKRFEECGFSKVSLGNRILRVETVPLLVLSILNFIWSD